MGKPALSGILLGQDLGLGIFLPTALSVPFWIWFQWPFLLCHFAFLSQLHHWRIGLWDIAKVISTTFQEFLTSLASNMESEACCEGPEPQYNTPTLARILLLAESSCASGKNRYQGQSHLHLPHSLSLWHLQPDPVHRAETRKRIRPSPELLWRSRCEKYPKDLGSEWWLPQQANAGFRSAH